ncbi:MAG: hypothetical protein BWY74_03580 [Firmicutes bacterium ADurb.Bin419]|jgi:hypothetical protein|nr:MAG: hypothetical protein BWY74_03580 [Firmicutes bacterium ADurb.Bin419]
MKDKEDEIPFDSGEPYKILIYKCKECGFEDEVPDFVVQESYIPEEFDKETGCPIIMCIKCDGVMIDKDYFDSSKRHRTK